MFKRVGLIVALGLTLSACSSGDESETPDESIGGGSYIGCVLEYNKLRLEGIITATDAEITSECAASSLPK